MSQHRNKLELQTLNPLFQLSRNETIYGQLPCSSTSLTADAVEEDEAVEEETSPISFPHSCSIFFRHDWQIASKSS